MPSTGKHTNRENGYQAKLKPVKKTIVWIFANKTEGFSIKYNGCAKYALHRTYRKMTSSVRCNSYMW